MALSVSILFFVAASLSVSFWGMVQYRREQITKRRCRLLVQAFRSTVL